MPLLHSIYKLPMHNNREILAKAHYTNETIGPLNTNKACTQLVQIQDGKYRMLVQFCTPLWGYFLWI